MATADRPGHAGRDRAASEPARRRDADQDLAWSGASDPRALVARGLVQRCAPTRGRSTAYRGTCVKIFLRATAHRVQGIRDTHPLTDPLGEVGHGTHDG